MLHFITETKMSINPGNYKLSEKTAKLTSAGKLDFIYSYLLVHNLISFFFSSAVTSIGYDFNATIKIVNVLLIE